MNSGESNGKTLKLWQVVVGQLPWFLTLLALGGWQMAKFDSRLQTLERATARIEARQEADQAEKLQELKEEVARTRKAILR